MIPPAAVAALVIGAVIGLMDTRNRVAGKVARVSELEVELAAAREALAAKSSDEDPTSLRSEIERLTTELAGLKAGKAARENEPPPPPPADDPPKSEPKPPNPFAE